MNGGISVPSTDTFTSDRGKLTLNTPSASFNVPLAPVIRSMAAVSNFGGAAKTLAQNRLKANSRAERRTTRRMAGSLEMWSKPVTAREDMYPCLNVLACRDVFGPHFQGAGHATRCSTFRPTIRLQPVLCQ